MQLNARGVVNAPGRGSFGDCHARSPLDTDNNPIHSVWTTELSCYKYPNSYSVMVAMGCHLKCPFCVVGKVQGEESGRARTIGFESVIALAEQWRADFGTSLIKLFFASSFASKADIDPLN